VARAESLKPRKKPVQDRSRHTVETILDCAAKVFAERGFAGGTTNHIAERAGVSVGSLYQYFPNKDAILMGLMERHLAGAQEEVERWVDALHPGPVDRTRVLRALVEALVSEQLIDPRLHRVLLEASLRSPALLEKAREMVGAMALLVEHILRELPGGTRVEDPALASRTAVLTGFLLTHGILLFESEQVPADRFIEQVVDMISMYLFGESPGDG